jgi:MarR family 2-MHQ and catechol resistance regulon transcriptional repressor
VLSILNLKYKIAGVHPLARVTTYGKRVDLALSTWVKLARAAAIVGKRTGEHIRSAGLTVGQFGAMDTIYHKGPMTPGELCSKQLVSGGNMTVVLDNLEKDGLVVRVPSKTDGRSVTIHLTPQGEAKMDQVFPEHARVVGELLASLSTEDQRLLGDLLRKLGYSVEGRYSAGLHMQERT